MKNSIVLYIDTSSNTEICVALIQGEKKAEVRKKLGKKRGQIVLPTIEKLLKDNGVRFSDLHGVEVNVGPGSFTGLRVGITIANALSFALKIPVNGKKQANL